MNRVKRVLEQGRTRTRISELEGCHQGRRLFLAGAKGSHVEGRRYILKRLREALKWF